MTSVVRASTLESCPPVVDDYRPPPLDHACQLGSELSCNSSTCPGAQESRCSRPTRHRPVSGKRACADLRAGSLRRALGRVAGGDLAEADTGPDALPQRRPCASSRCEMPVCRCAWAREKHPQRQIVRAFHAVQPDDHFLIPGHLHVLAALRHSDASPALYSKPATLAGAVGVDRNV